MSWGVFVIVETINQGVRYNHWGLSILLKRFCIWVGPIIPTITGIFGDYHPGLTGMESTYMSIPCLTEPSPND